MSKTYRKRGVSGVSSWGTAFLTGGRANADALVGRRGEDPGLRTTGLHEDSDFYLKCDSDGAGEL